MAPPVSPTAVGVQLVDRQGNPARERSESAVQVGVRVASHSIGDGAAVVAGVPVRPSEVRAMAQSVSATVSDPRTPSIFARSVTVLCGLACIIVIGLVPAIYCLVLYYETHDLPCDRSIPYCLMMIGWSGIAIQVVTMVMFTLRTCCCPKRQGANEDDDKVGDLVDAAQKLLVCVPSVISGFYWMQLNGICWWMNPYENDIVQELDNGALVPNFNATDTPKFAHVLWYAQNDITLLNIGIEGCHPDTLFGARDYLIFTYSVIGILCACVCCVIPCCICAFMAGKITRDGSNNV